ncbi:MAG: 3,4-dehydroadipyl-CoA semialdehyde dehydrogenase [Acidobacteriota bacterium]|jgi:oxepin-CoA hydrolase/3-oxo-5,6-dehydrosuberyl-CoA semialdehyde dehydrogenase
MKTLRSHVQGTFHEAKEGFVNLVDPCSEEVIGRASSAGIDFGATVAFAREQGRAALAELTLAQRGALLKAMSKAMHAHRDELLDLSITNTGTTRKDAKFDVDGGTFTLSHYAAMGEALGEGRALVDGDGIQLGRTPRFWGQHLLVPRDGVAVHINAFNFPVWGWAEKAACALLAGMPVITKPATSTAMVAERCMEILEEAKVLPAGVLSMICGSTGDLLDHLGPQDVLAFTGSADTALKLRGRPNLLRNSTRVNIEADSLNAAIVGPDVSEGETWGAFLRDVIREITQKTGQKCTAVRRILVPESLMDAVQEALVAGLTETVTGNPRDGSVTMGPLATRQQLDDAVAGVARLREDADPVLGTGERADGVGNPEGKGFFLAPTLLRLRDGASGEAVHRHEVFGPVSTLIPYDGTAAEAARLVARGEGSLVTSIYSDDETFLGEYLAHGGHTSGRLYLGSEKVAPQLPGSGVAMPQVLHGGPGRAGGGAELGGERGLALYLQDVAVTGDRGIVERLAGLR